MHARRQRLFAFAFLIALPAGPTDDLAHMSLEELMDIEVSLQSRKPRPISESAASVAVITADDLRRSGVRSLPEALRLVPGLQVGVVDANKWNVTARGFSGLFANKLLVLIDGRSVYTPLFSGVFWESQDVLFEDVERIEIIRGPGWHSLGIECRQWDHQHRHPHGRSDSRRTAATGGGHR